MPGRNVRYTAASLRLGMLLWMIALVQLPIASAGPHKWGDHWNDEERYHEEFHHTYALNSNGVISLENVNGGVTVSAWDRNEAQVEAVKYARTEDYLHQIEIQVDSRSDELRIKTHLPDHFQGSAGGVRYTLTVPRTARIDQFRLVNGPFEIDGVRGDVKASLVNGTVKAHGLGGAVEFSTVNGRQQVALDALNVTKPVRLESVNGAGTDLVAADGRLSSLFL
jgi:hypothetical protein